MNWYKLAKNFDKRNIMNHKILYLKDLKTYLDKLSKLVFQSGKNTKIGSHSIVTGKKITSYPGLRKILIEADSIVLDNPWRFQELYKIAMEKIQNMIWDLEDEREIFTLGKQKHNVQKGWRDNV